MIKTKIKLKTKFILARTASLFFILFLAAVNSNTVLASDLYYNNPQITPAKMLSLTNQSRERNKLPDLIVNQKLVSAAKAKIDDMFKYQYFDHNSPSGVTPWDWIKAAGYNYRYAGENLAIDFVTAESAHKALMASSSHRENILNQNYTEIGISVKRNIFEGSKSVIIVMEFGTPLTTEAVHINNNANEDIKLNEDVKSSNDEKLNDNKTSDNISNIKEKPQKKIINSQPSVIPLDVKKDSDKKIAYNIKAIEFVGILASSIRRNNLKKVYLENIYWKSCNKKNANGQTTIMLSSEQNKNIFNQDIFYVCVLLILFVFESSYLFSSFVISRKFKTENIQSGELDISLKL